MVRDKSCRSVFHCDGAALPDRTYGYVGRRLEMRGQRNSKENIASRVLYLGGKRKIEQGMFPDCEIRGDKFIEM